MRPIVRSPIVTSISTLVYFFIKLCCTCCLVVITMLDINFTSWIWNKMILHLSQYDEPTFSGKIIALRLNICISNAELKANVHKRLALY